MKKENRKLIQARYLGIIILILAFVGSIIYQLVNTTVVHADKWNEMAMKKLSRYDTIAPLRGNILAADGSVLATNLRQYTIRIDFRASRFDSILYCDTINALADSMALHFPRRNAEQWKAYLLEPLSRKRKPTGFKVVDNVSYADYQLLLTFPFFSEKSRNRTGLIKEAKMRRINPYGSMALRSIGRVGATDACKEVHGRSGLEMALDSLLYGREGYAKKVPLTKAIVNWTDQAPVNGLNIHTTIDIKMQDIVENELNAILEESRADWGVAVLMDVATGDIKAISNLQIDSVTGDYIEGQNRAVQRFEPGSVIKAVSMLVALENGAVSPNQVISTPSPYHFAGGRPIRDCSPVASMSVMEICERSSNIGMTRVIASKYGQNPGAFYSALKKIGFLDPLNVGIGGERVPHIDSLANEARSLVPLSRQCYGYATEIPPLHTLAIYNAIANGGRFVRPRLVQRIFSQTMDSIVPVTYVRDRICSEKNAATLREMLRRVVDGNHGTARALRNEKVAIAGKTGTALVIEDKQYTSKKRLSFCGFFPADKPKYSCIVLVSNPRSGAGAARTSGMVVKNVALRLYSRGMLDNNSEFDGRSMSTSAPTLYASRSDAKRKELDQAFGVPGSRKVMSAPVRKEHGVPAVGGLGIRDAIAMLEEAGYNVSMKGSGCVVAQNPAAGTPLRRGATVHLSLAN